VCRKRLYILNKIYNLNVYILRQITMKGGVIANRPIFSSDRMPHEADNRNGQITTNLKYGRVQAQGPRRQGGLTNRATVSCKVTWICL